MTEPYIGEIRMFGFDWAPRGWAKCDGQLLPIAQNQALFSLLGTIYGGDGRTTFGLPDLRGRVPVHQGTGSGLSDRRIGQRGGSEIQSIDASLSQGGQTSVNPGGSPYLTVNFCIALVGTYPERS